jgi:hypothetical protein
MLFDPNATDDEIFEDLRMMPTLILHMNLEEMNAALLSKIADLVIFDPTYINLIKNHLKGSSKKIKIFQILFEYNIKMIKYLDDLLDIASAQEEIDLFQLFNSIRPMLSDGLSLWKYIPSIFYKSPEIYKILKETYMSDPESLLVFHQLSLDLRDDLEVANWAISYDSSHFMCLSLRLKDCEELFVKAIQNNIALFKYGSARLQQNQSLLLDLFNQYAAQKLNNPHTFDGRNDLIYAFPLSLQRNNEFMISVFLTISNGHLKEDFDWSCALEYWFLDYATLFKNPFVRSIIIQKYPDIIFKTIQDQVKNQKDFFIELFEKSCFRRDYLKYASKEIKNDKQVALLAVQSSFFNFKHLPSHLRNDIDVLFCFVNQDNIYAQDLEDSLAHVSKKSINHPKISQTLAKKHPKISIKFSKIKNQLQKKISFFLKKEKEKRYF